MDVNKGPTLGNGKGQVIKLGRSFTSALPVELEVVMQGRTELDAFPSRVKSVMCMAAVDKRQNHLP